MVKVIGSAGIGKSLHLMQEAEKANGVFVCANVQKALQTASYNGIKNVEIISYRDYFFDNYDMDKKVFIDELDKYMNECEFIDGFSLTV